MGRYFDPSTRTAVSAIWQLAEPADGTVKIQLFKGNIHFLSLTDCPHSVYFEADSSMEASEGLNPVSSQGFLEVFGRNAKVDCRHIMCVRQSVYAFLVRKLLTN